jgi:hypothetical protein
VHGEKVPTTCTGPTINISFLPKTCVIEDAAKQIVCDPAKLVLIKSPGSCTLKHYTASTWTGKQCRLKTTRAGSRPRTCGINTGVVLGGNEVPVPLGSVDLEAVQQWASDLFHRDNAPTR